MTDLSMSPPLRLGLAARLAADTAADLRARAAATPGIELVDVRDPIDPAAGHLVVDGRAGDAVDACLDGPAAVEAFWTRRLVPFAHLLARGQRAPRARTVTVADHDPGWPAAAARWGARVRSALGARALRIEHVGSTSVPGMAGKDLVDLLVVVEDLDAVDALGRAAWHRAGVVPVAGDFYGIDRHDREHPQRVAVDADPGRPLNVHLHPRASPVWRELLAFRDRLRADEEHRAAYVALKHRLAREAGGDVDVYSRGKRAWINEAVARALG
ncbi:GrpB family protein [Actinomycetospora sp. C-140]